MRIGINGRFLMAKQTGVQRAAYNMVSALVRNDRCNSYFIFTGEGESVKRDWDFPNVTVVTSHLRAGETLRNMLWEQITLPRLAKAYKVDLLHSPANMAPLFYSGKSVIHIHDLCFIVNPHWYSFAFRNWYRFVIPHIVRKATHVVTNSNNSRNDLMQYCGVSSEKVSLVYWAVDESFLQEQAGQVDEVDRPRKDYILYVGSLEPRKNIKRLVEAYIALRKAHPSLKTKLVLIGGESPLFADLSLVIREFREDVILKGFVNEAVLREYYRDANLVVYPSLYEGFGLPPLEAMASGTPVLVSQNSSLPEVVGDAALSFDAVNVAELQSSIYKVLSEPQLRQQMILAGYKQVRRFSWDRVCRNILGIYNRTYCGRPISFADWKTLPGLTAQASRPSKVSGGSPAIV